MGGPHFWMHTESCVLMARSVGPSFSCRSSISVRKTQPSSTSARSMPVGTWIEALIRTRFWHVIHFGVLWLAVWMWSPTQVFCTMLKLFSWETYPLALVLLATREIRQQAPSPHCQACYSAQSTHCTQACTCTLYFKLNFCLGVKNHIYECLNVLIFYVPSDKLTFCYGQSLVGGFNSSEKY